MCSHRKRVFDFLQMLKVKVPGKLVETLYSASEVPVSFSVVIEPDYVGMRVLLHLRSEERSKLQ